MHPSPMTPGARVAQSVDLSTRRNKQPLGPQLAALQRKAVRVAHVLEQFVGVPAPPRKKARPIDMLIATLLSQNTNDKNSHRAYLKLRKLFPRWEDVLSAPTRTLAAAIRVGGMANQKSARIKGILKAIKTKYGKLSLDSLRKKTDDEVYDELLSLNGVGVKTAACVLVFSLGRDLFPVDTHIHRICGRLGLAPGCSTPEKTFLWMKNVVPNGKAYSFHTNLIQFGRSICRSQKPLCNVCPVYDQCEYVQKEFYRSAARLPSSKVDHRFMLLDNVA